MVEFSTGTTVITVLVYLLLDTDFQLVYYKFFHVRWKSSWTNFFPYNFSWSVFKEILWLSLYLSRGSAF